MISPAAQTIVEQYGKNPYCVLISCILSLRTKDRVSLPASQRLFEHAITPYDMIKIPLNTIQELIYPVGFYRIKARTIHDISLDVISRFQGQVPSSLEELLTLQGVGPKTAHLVQGEGFGIPALCVDTHVHRISNRLGIVRTKTPEETERELKKIIPVEYWIEYNRLLVMWGQNTCLPISPLCSVCPLANICQQVGVITKR